MHDPMVVAFQVKLPIPRRDKYRERSQTKRWALGRRRFTNPEHVGKAIYPWRRPYGYEPVIAGRCYRWRLFITVWHVEPNGHDSGTVCKHYDRWQDEDGWHTKQRRAWLFHVHHWHIQIPVLQGLRARLFDRCTLCGRKGRPNISHQWDGPKVGWRKWRSRGGLYHHECSELVSARRSINESADLIRHLFAALRVELDIDERDLLARLTDPKSRGLEFHESYRLTRLLGFERDDNYDLVRKP